MGREEELVLSLAKNLCKRDLPESDWSYLSIDDKQEYLNEAKVFLDGCRKGLQARREGEVRPWSEIKAELGIK